MGAVVRGTAWGRVRGWGAGGPQWVRGVAVGGAGNGPRPGRRWDHGETTDGVLLPGAGREKKECEALFLQKNRLKKMDRIFWDRKMSTSDPYATNFVPVSLPLRDGGLSEAGHR